METCHNGRGYNNNSRAPLYLFIYLFFAAITQLSATNRIPPEPETLAARCISPQHAR